MSEKKQSDVLELVFETKYLASLFGDDDQNLKEIAKILELKVLSKGNKVLLSGDQTKILQAQSVLEQTVATLKAGHDVGLSDVRGFLRTSGGVGENKPLPNNQSKGMGDGIPTRKGLVRPRTPGQAEYLQALRDYDLVFGMGPAGTGKTYLAVAMGVSLLLEKRIERLILSRPAVEAGEQLGFLPGDLREKIDPYLRPLYDALHDMIPRDQVEAKLKNGEIEIAPLAYMRGRTLGNAYVILDEAQNTLSSQMKMILTRLGEGARMVVTGDLSQVDLPRGKLSGLREAHTILKDVPSIKFCSMTTDDVVRHPLVAAIVNAYDAHEPHNPYEDKDGETPPER
ncbi:MAG: PhoH family protein [Alphaproteobacteria bacterium]|nr:MAG: PhoH family protein [Alphaproteobacteria bacterium]